MKKMKRILSIMLVLMLALALVPTAGALEIEDGTVTIFDNTPDEDLYTALTTDGVESVYVWREFTINKDITIPEEVYVYFGNGVTIAEGVTVTVEEYGDISVSEKLVLNGTIHLNADVSWSYIYTGTQVSGNGSITGTGIVNVYDGNDITQGQGGTEIRYSDMGNVKIGSEVNYNYNLDVTADHLKKVNKPLKDYSAVTIMINNYDENCELVIDQKIDVNTLYLSGYLGYNEATGKWDKPYTVNLVVASGGELNVAELLSVGGCTLTVKAGGKVNVSGMTYIGGAYSDEDYNEFAGKVIVEKGGSMTAGSLGSMDTNVANGQAVVKAEGDFTYSGVSYGELMINGELVKAFSADDFTDVPDSAFYKESVEWAVSWGITNGTSSTTFSPLKPCTRGEVVTFLWRAAGSPDPESSENPFTDVPEGKYYTDAVLWAVENDITNGITKNTFQPDATCTRGQVVTFLWRAAGKPDAPAGKTDFTDVAAGAYYENGVKWAVANGITNGVDAKTFAPNKVCNRSEIVTFLYRFFMG